MANETSKAEHDQLHAHRFDLDNCEWCRWEFDDMCEEIVG